MFFRRRDVYPGREPARLDWEGGKLIWEATKEVAKSIIPPGAPVDITYALPGWLAGRRSWKAPCVLRSLSAKAKPSKASHLSFWP